MLTGVIIGVFIVDFNVNIPPLRQVTNQLTSWGVVIGALTIGLGYINMFNLQGGKVRRREGGWPFALWLLIGLTAVSIIGAIQGQTGSLMLYIYNSIIGPMDGTFYSIAVFYMASAAFRGYRFRSKEAAVLIGAGVLMLLKNAPIGDVIWSGFTPLGNWLQDYPVMGVARAITLSITLGSVALALRVLVGKEYSYLAGTQEATE